MDGLSSSSTRTPSPTKHSTEWIEAGPPSTGRGSDARRGGGTHEHEAQLDRHRTGNSTDPRNSATCATRRSGEGGAHGGEGRGAGGELLELEGGLVDEQVEAGDQHLVVPTASAPTRPAGSARGGRRPRTRRVRPRSGRPGRRSGRRRGWSTPRPRRRPRRRAARPPPRSGAAGWRPRAATASAARAGSRTSRRMRAGAQAGQRQADGGRGRAAAQDGRGRDLRPSTAPAAPPPRPGRRCCRRATGRPSWTRVLATPAIATVGETTSARTAASRLSGAVTDSPRHSGPSPSTNAAEPARRHPVGVVLPVQPPRGVRRPVQRRRQRVGDRVTQHPTPHRRLPSVD